MEIFMLLLIVIPSILGCIALGLGTVMLPARVTRPRETGAERDRR